MTYAGTNYSSQAQRKHKAALEYYERVLRENEFMAKQSPEDREKFTRCIEGEKVKEK